MDKYFNPGTHILTSNRSLVSEHVEHLFHMIAHKNAKGLINQIAFNEDLPAKQFGHFHGPSHSLCVNLKAHVAHCLSKIETKNPNMSLRALLIMEFVNTALHETRHAIWKDDKDNFSDEETDEEENTCQKFADEEMWEAGKYVDLEIQSFGKIIDEQLTLFYNDLKETKNSDICQDWQLKQFNMIEKSILYFDAKNELVIKNMMELCSYFSKTEGWDKANYIPFEPDYYETELTDDPETFEPTEAAQTLIQETAKVESGPTIVPDGYDALTFEDIDYELPDMSAIPDSLPAYEAPVETITIEPTVAEQVETQAQISYDPRQVVEIVLRRMNNHIYSKCGWDGHGKFLNAGAVLEPLPIDDIYGATDMFKQMDMSDVNGVYTHKADIVASIRGLISKQGLPMYRIWIAQNGQLHKRTFIPQNPEKTNASGQLTTWANKVRAGNRITMLLQDNTGPRMHLEGESNEPLGQEKFVVWDK